MVFPKLEAVRIQVTTCCGQSSLRMVIAQWTSVFFNVNPSKRLLPTRHPKHHLAPIEWGLFYPACRCIDATWEGFQDSWRLASWVVSRSQQGSQCLFCNKNNQHQQAPKIMTEIECNWHHKKYIVYIYIYCFIYKYKSWAVQTAEQNWTLTRSSWNFR